MNSRIKVCLKSLCSGHQLKKMNSQAQSPFFRLPAEIRLAIYEHLQPVVHTAVDRVYVATCYSLDEHSVFPCYEYDLSVPTEFPECYTRCLSRAKKQGVYQDTWAGLRFLKTCKRM